MPEYGILTQRDIDEINRLRRKLGNVNGPGITNSPEGIATSGAAVIQYANSRGIECIFARLVDYEEANPWRWSWQQVERDDDANWNDGDLKGSLTGDNPNYAIELRENTEDEADDVVILLRLPVHKAEGGGIFGWVFMGRQLGKGEFAWQSLSMGPDNERIWDWDRLHPLLNNS